MGREHKRDLYNIVLYISKTVYVLKDNVDGLDIYTPMLGLCEQEIFSAVVKRGLVFIISFISTEFK